MMDIQDYIHVYECDYSTAKMFQEWDKRDRERELYQAALKRDEYARQQRNN